MADFVILTCPSCGGKLQLTNDIEHFACAHCGNEHMVKRSGGVVTLAVVEGLKKVQAGVDKTASELAIRRLPDELRILKDERLRVTSDMENRIRLISQELEKRISDDPKVTEKLRRAETTPALLFTIVSCGFLAIGIWSLFTNSASPSESWLIIIGSILMILIFGSRLITVNRSNDMLEQQISQFYNEKQKQQKQIETIRIEVEAVLLKIDDKITKKQQELDKHLRTVSD